MNHKAIKIKLKQNVIEIRFDAKDFASDNPDSIPKLAKKVQKNQEIPPEFVIEILARAMLAKKGKKVAATDAKGTVINW